MTTKSKTETKANCRIDANETIKINKLQIVDKPAKLTAKEILIELTESDIMELRPKRNSPSHYRNVIYELWAESMEKMPQANSNIEKMPQANPVIAFMVYSNFKNATDKVLHTMSDEQRILIKTGLKFGTVMDLIIKPHYGEDVSKQTKDIAVSAFMLAEAEGVGDLGRAVRNSNTKLGQFLRERFENAKLGLLRKSSQTASGNELETAA